MIYSRQFSCWYFLIILYLFASTSYAHSQEISTLTNDEVVLKLIEQEVLSAVEPSLVARSLVVSEIQPVNPLSQWLRTKITRACLNKDYVVYSTADSVKSAPSLRVVQPVLQITYHTAGRNWFFRSKEYTRRMLLKMQLEVVAADGRVLISEPVNAIYEDRINRSELESFQKSPQSFLRGTKSDSGLIKRWLEPVATTLATTTVVYLFYSLRSD